MSGMKMKAFSDGASPNLTKGSFILRHSHLRFLVTYGHYGLICFIFVAILWPGPVYLWLRSSIVWLRRFPGRHWMRWIERNSDYQKMCLMGMPEFHIDPTKNRWRRGEWAACGPAR
jgi:hypothetical protein